MKSSWWMRVAVMAVFLALVVPTAAAGKGGKGGGGGGGGGGEDPAPTCTSHVYALWQYFDGTSGPRGVARVCAEGGTGELLTGDTTYWLGPIEVSPDGTQVVDSSKWELIDFSAPTAVRSLNGTDLPRGTHASWSWRVDTAGDPLAAADQYLVVARDFVMPIDDYGTTQVTWDLMAFHPASGATEFALTDLPYSYTRTPATVADPDTGADVDGAIVNIVSTQIKAVTWLAGTVAQPDVSWIVFQQETTDESWEVVGDATGYTATSISKTVDADWKAMTVQTSATGVTVLRAPQDLIAAGDLASVDVLAGTANLRPSKFGTHVFWEFAENAGMRRAALVYSSTDAYAPPQLDATTIETIDSGLYGDLGSVPFANVAIKEDGSTLAVALGEVWTMDIDTGASSLTQVSETVRKRKPGYGVAVAWGK